MGLPKKIIFVISTAL